jgi:CRP/FNR family cyclic AMP-dependent transcriptional regulator
MSANDAEDFLRHCADERGGGTLDLPRWTADDWRALFDCGRTIDLDQGGVLMQHGDEGRALYFVVRGTIELNAKTQRGGALGTLVRQRAGSVLGEVAFFDGRGRSATVWAAEPTRLVKLDVAGFDVFAAGHAVRANELLFALGQVLAHRLRRGEERRDAASYY